MSEDTGDYVYAPPNTTSYNLKIRVIDSLPAQPTLCHVLRRNVCLVHNLQLRHRPKRLHEDLALAQRPRPCHALPRPRLLLRHLSTNPSSSVTPEVQTARYLGAYRIGHRQLLGLLVADPLAFRHVQKRHCRPVGNLSMRARLCVRLGVNLLLSL